MSTHHKNPQPLHKGSRNKTLPKDRAVMTTHAQTGRVLVIETLHAAEDIIRVSIETARSAGLPERVIVF
jgi:hypothetical protein